MIDYIEDKGEDYYQVAIAHGLEGVVAKRKDSIYEESKRSDCGSKLRI